MTFLRNRKLADDTTLYTGVPKTREGLNFIKTFIDQSITKNCVVIVVYVKPDTSTFDLVEWDYGSVKSNFKIVKPPTPSYIDIEIPSPVYDSGSTTNIEQWAYFRNHPTNASNTLLTVISIDNTTNTHTKTINYPLTGNPYKMVFQNDKCKVLSGAGSVSINVEVNGAYASISTLDTVLSGITVTPNTVWQFSDDCIRAQVGNNYLYFNGTWNKFNTSGMTISSVDRNVSVALDSNSNIWLFNMFNGTLVNIFNPPVPFPAFSTIHTFENTIGLGSTNATSAWFSGFILNSSTLTLKNCLNYSFHNFTTQPRIEHSRTLTKVIVYGMAKPPHFTNKTTPIPRADMFFINCPKFYNISFPLEHLKAPAKVNIKVTDEFVHLLKLDNSNAPN